MFEHSILKWCSDLKCIYDICNFIITAFPFFIKRWNFLLLVNKKKKKKRPFCFMYFYYELKFLFCIYKIILVSFEPSVRISFSLINVMYCFPLPSFLSIIFISFLLGMYLHAAMPSRVCSLFKHWNQYALSDILFVYIYFIAWIYFVQLIVVVVFKTILVELSVLFQENLSKFFRRNWNIFTINFSPFDSKFCSKSHKTFNCVFFSLNSIYIL